MDTPFQRTTVSVAFRCSPLEFAIGFLFEFRLADLCMVVCDLFVAGSGREHLGPVRSRLQVRY